MYCRKLQNVAFHKSFPEREKGKIYRSALEVRLGDALCTNQSLERGLVPDQQC
jgi:hypothetical protein